MLVSVIIPCHNVENYISECLQSALGQTYQDIEIICVDNNSTDKTLKIVQEFQDKYPEKIFVTEELKQGAPAARNNGLSLAKGEWIQFLDADDLLMPGKIQHQIALAISNPGAGFISGAYIAKSLKGEEIINLPGNEDVFKSLFSKNLGITSANLWHKTDLLNVHGWDESLKSSQEADLMFRLLKMNENVISDFEPLTIVRERKSGQISQRNPLDKWLDYFNKRIEILQWIEQNKPAYYSENRQYYYDELFFLIKGISHYNLNLACKLHKEKLGKAYKPGKIHYSMQRRYMFVYNILGLRFTEILYRIFLNSVNYVLLKK